MIVLGTERITYESIMGNDAGFRFMTGYEITEMIHRRIFGEVFRFIREYDSDGNINLISLPTSISSILTESRAFVLSNPPVRLDAILGRIYNIDTMLHISNNDENSNHIQVWYSNNWVRKTKINMLYNDSYTEKILDKIYIDVKLIPYI